MTRREALGTLMQQYPYKKSFKKLADREFLLIEAFMVVNSDLNHIEFEYKVNRMFLDYKDKPKNWVIIQELLVASNSAALGRSRS